MFAPPIPVSTTLVLFQDVDNFLSEIEDIDGITGGVGVFGPAAAYALVWELGSLRLKSPGPKTVWGTNRLGERVILTRQAPRGYVGILSKQFWPIIQNEISKVDFSGRNFRLKMEIAFENAGVEIAKIIREKAPVDSGELRTDITWLDPAEASQLSASIGLESAGTLIL